MKPATSNAVVGKRYASVKGSHNAVINLDCTKEGTNPLLCNPSA